MERSGMECVRVRRENKRRRGELSMVLREGRGKMFGVGLGVNGDILGFSVFENGKCLVLV